MEIKQDHVEPIDINYAVDPNFQDEQLLSPECCSATYNWQQASMFSFKPLDQEHHMVAFPFLFSIENYPCGTKGNVRLPEVQTFQTNSKIFS